MNKENKIEKWIAGKLSDSEKKEFEATGEFARISRLLKAVRNFKAPKYSVDDEYRRLSGCIGQPKRSVSLYRTLNPVIRVAAIIIVALLIGYFSYDQFVITDSAQWIVEQEEVYMPDSSVVNLNADSRIRFSNENWKEERNVELQGEAFFSVKKGSHFVVKSSSGKVTVLGTEFVVKDRKSYYEVSCYSGMVEVKTGEHSVILKPNSVFRIIHNKAENYSIPDQSEPNWMNGECSFKSVPLWMVIEELERQYKVSVKTQDVDLDQLFTGRFTHDDLEIALKTVSYPLNLKYKINRNKIELTFEGK